MIISQYLAGSKSAGDGANSHALCRATAHMQDLQVFLEAVGRHFAAVKWTAARHHLKGSKHTNQIRRFSYVLL